MSNLREQILAAEDLKPVGIDVPGWGKVHIKPWSAALRQQFAEAIDKDPKCAEARLAIMSLCDEQGKLLFTEQDIPALMNKSAIALESIARQALELNGFGDRKKS